MNETILARDDKSKSFIRRVLENRELFPAILIVVVGVISFGLGRLSVEKSSGVPPQNLVSSVQGTGEASRSKAANTSGSQNQNASSQKSAASSQGDGVSSSNEENAANTSKTPVGEKKYVGSKNSNKYHLPWCSGAARIAEENKIWFASKEEAAAAGYTPAGNCKGI